MHTQFKKYIFLSVLGLLLVSGGFVYVNTHQSTAQTLPTCTQTTVGGFTHPGMLSNCTDLEFMRGKVLANEQPWASGYTKVGAHIDIIQNDSIVGSTGSNAGSIKNHVPNPVVHYFNEVGPSDIVVKKLSADSKAAYANALRYYVSGDVGYAQTGVNIIKAWATTLETIQPNHEESRLTTSNLWPSMIWAAEILKATYPNWTAEMGSAEADLEDLLANMVWDHTSPTCTMNCHPYPFTAPTQNHGAWGTAARMAIAIYLNDSARYNQAINEYKVIMPGYIKRGTGKPEQPDGFTIETCRHGGDLWHTQMAFAPFTAISEMAWKHGDDLYSFDNHRLKLGIDYHAQFIGWKEGRYDSNPTLKQQVKDAWPCPAFGGYGEPPRELDDPNNDTDWWTFYEMSYNHYNGRLGMAAQEIADVINDVPGYRPELYKATMGWGTFTHVESPGPAPTPTPTPTPTGIATEPNFKVGFIGDSAFFSGFDNVLTLLKNEGVDMIIHNGDMAYDENNPNAPAEWHAKVQAKFADNFPYLFTVGNHDLGCTDPLIDYHSDPSCGGGTNHWTQPGGYGEILQNRIAQSGVVCDGDPGIKAACHYKGFYFILSGIGETGSGHESYIGTKLDEANTAGYLWKSCNWHKNHSTMQVGTKTNEVPISAYDLCRDKGAFIATGHEHSYSRTKTLTNFGSRSIDSFNTGSEVDARTRLKVEPGKSFAFVSGIGGKDARNQDRCSPFSYPYGCNGEWAHIYTSDQGATPGNYGALIIEFHVDGDPAKARGQFKHTNGSVIDPEPQIDADGWFDIYTVGSGVPPTTTPTPSPPITTPPPTTSTPPPTTNPLPGSCGGGTPGIGGHQKPDLNADGCVDFIDTAILLSCWGVATKPSCYETGLPSGPGPTTTPPPTTSPTPTPTPTTSPTPTPGPGNTINAVSGSRADIQAAVDIASSGDTVVVPAGTFNFSGQVTIPAGVNIRGAGENSTRLVKTDAGNTDPMIQYDCSTTQGFTVSDMALEGIDTVTQPLVEDTGLSLGISNSTNSNACENFRVHDMTFESFGRAGIAVWGGIRGVIDNNLFENNYFSPVAGLNLGYGVEVYGNADWPALELGTENAVFIETNEFIGNRHAATSNNGAHYVFRYNTVREHYNEGGAVDVHGQGTWPRGGRSIEVYENTFTHSNQYNGGVWLRGGDGVVFNNSFDGPLSNTILLSNDNGGNGCSYPCQDQIRELHVWGNTYTGGTSPVTVQGTTVTPSGGYVGDPTTISVRHATVLQPGRDYFDNNTARPGYAPYTYPHPLRNATPPPSTTPPSPSSSLLTRFADAGVSRYESGAYDNGIPSQLSQDWDWDSATFYTGVWRTYEVTGDTAYRDAVRWYVDQFVGNDGSFSYVEEGGVTRTAPRELDTVAGFLLVAELYEDTGETKYLTAARNALDVVCAVLPRSSVPGFDWQGCNAGDNRSIEHKFFPSGELWDDSVFMVSGFLARMGAIENNTQYYDEAVNQLITHLEAFRRPDSNSKGVSNSFLQVHAWDGDQSSTWAGSDNRSSEIWGRGNGWVAAGVVDVMRYLPVSHLRRGDVITYLNQFFSALANKQDASGLWWTVVDKGGQAGNFLETSGSALILYALSEARDQGLLSHNYDSEIDAALAGLLTRISDTSGNVTLSDATEGTGPGGYNNYINRATHTNTLWGDGAALMALSNFHGDSRIAYGPSASRVLGVNTTVKNYAAELPLHIHIFSFLAASLGLSTLLWFVVRGRVF